MAGADLENMEQNLPLTCGDVPAAAAVEGAIAEMAFFFGWSQSLAICPSAECKRARIPHRVQRSAIGEHWAASDPGSRVEQRRVQLAAGVPAHVWLAMGTVAMNTVAMRTAAMRRVANRRSSKSAQLQYIWVQ